MDVARRSPCRDLLGMLLKFLCNACGNVNVVPLSLPPTEQLPGEPGRHDRPTVAEAEPRTDEGDASRDWLPEKACEFMLWKLYYIHSVFVS